MQLPKDVKFCYLICQDILTSVVQVKFLWRHFLYRLLIFVDFQPFQGNLRNIQLFSSSYEKKYSVSLLTSRYSYVIGAYQNFLEAFCFYR